MGTRTPLFSRKTPGGVFVISDFPTHPGDLWFVYSGASAGADSAGYGKNPDRPFLTLDYAVGAASAGDTIYLLPGHAESKAASGNLAAIDVAGLQIIGLGTGSRRPTFTLGHADATITVSAANVLLRNVKVIADVADVAVGLTVTADADGLVVEDSWFTDGGLTKELVIGISLAANADQVTIRRCRFETADSAETGGCASAVKTVGAAIGLEIRDCTIQGHYTAAALDLDAAAVTFQRLIGNSIIQVDSDAGLAISCHAASTGHVIRNLISNLKDTVAGVVAAGCHVAENYGSNALGASGLIKPAVDS